MFALFLGQAHLLEHPSESIHHDALSNFMAPMPRLTSFELWTWGEMGLTSGATAH
jgi:hypothetical protein